MPKKIFLYAALLGYAPFGLAATTDTTLITDAQSWVGWTAPTTLDAQTAARLGWTPAPITSKNYCGGYYEDPLASLLNQTLPPLQITPVNVDADQALFKQSGTSTLIGSVTLNQIGRSIHADRVYLNRDKTSGKLNDATLVGNVSLREPGKIILANQAHVELQTKIGQLFKTIYRVLVSTLKPGTVNTPNPLSAWGTAKMAEQQDSGLIILHDASYSTCSPTTSVWQVTAHRIVLNNETGRGIAHEAWLTIHDVPIFYVPYFDFPIDTRRQSGFLIPTLSSSSASGASLALPYYWNIAPNYDATLTPDIYSKRGLQINTLFRYLTPTNMGNINVSFLPHDHAFNSFKNEAPQRYSPGPLLNTLENNSDNRTYFALNNKSSFDSHWSSLVDFNYVSDSYYYQDFGTPHTLVPNQLPQQGSINYAGQNWNFTGALEGYETLHPINLSTVTNPYLRLPELDFNGNYPNALGELTYQLNSQLVYFTRETNPGEVILPPNTIPPSAKRYNIEPGISLPLAEPSGYFTPALQLSVTHYDVNNQVSGFNSSIQRNIPIFNIDSGLYFDKNTSFSGKEYEQTLEPRIFYLFVPYKNQDNIPLFDTAIIPFSYDSMFMTNRFSGLDRIGDANQISVGLTSRFLDANTGDEKFRASIGQIYYFENRRITSCVPAGSPGAASSDSVCTDAATVLGATSPTEPSSPYAGQLSYYFNPLWSAVGNVVWDPHQREMVNSNVNLHYQPQLNRIFNVTYNFIRFGDVITTIPVTPPLSHENDLNQLGFSFAWPIKDHWSTVGGWNYNMSRYFPQSFFYGIQYDTCCWGIRMVAGRTFTALNQNGSPIFNNGFYLQWQLKGLGALGSGDPTGMLSTNIPGYQDNFQGS